MADTIKTAGASTIAGGFEFDIRADLDLLISQSQKLQTITKPSSLTAGQDITIASGKNTQITGADITAGKAITITAQNTEITAAADTTTEQREEKQTHLSYGLGLFGGPETGGIDASISDNTLNRTSYKNAQIKTENLTINTTENTRIRGANLNTNTLQINTGKDLTIESLQDKYFEQGINFGFGISFEENKEYGIRGSYGQTTGNGKWVTEQTSLYGKNSLSINTRGQTNFIGATADTATGNLLIETGKLSYRDISDRTYKNSIGVQASITNKISDTGAASNSKEFKAELSITDRLQKTKTAIGKGEIIIRDNPDQDLSDLSRNTKTAQTRTGEINLDISVETDTFKAFDPNSYEALKNLPQNILQIGKNITRETEDLITSLKNSSPDGSITDYIRKTASREAILKINANPEIKEILENQTDYTTEQVMAVTQYIASIISKVRFEEPPEVRYYNGDQLTDNQKYAVNEFGETIDKSAAYGFFDPAAATIYINAAANETSHYIDHKNRIKFDGLTGVREQISDIAFDEIINT